MSSIGLAQLSSAILFYIVFKFDQPNPLFVTAFSLKVPRYKGLVGHVNNHQKNAPISNRLPILRLTNSHNENEVTSDNSILSSKSSSIDRRSTLSLIALSTQMGILLNDPKTANSIGFFPTEERRQLELCIVTIIRTQYWAQKISMEISKGLENQDKKSTIDAYIEARLGSKALLTKKTGAGSNANVYRLAKFEVRECLRDAVTYCAEDEKIFKKTKSKSKTEQTTYTRYCARRTAEDQAQDIIESLATCLEFDGLDNLTDSSPRSSLMTSQFTNDKARFVERMLKERTIPACSAFLGSIFNLSSNDSGTLRQRCLDFVARTYSSEIPVVL